MFTIENMMLYVLVGMLLVIPIVGVVALVSDRAFLAALEKSREFCTRWVKFGGADVSRILSKAFNVASVSGTALLLMAAAYSLDRLADDVAPATSSLVSHFGYPSLAWSEAAAQDWEWTVRAYRDCSGICGNHAAYEADKATMGRHVIRFFRSAHVIGLLMVAVGASMLFVRRHRRLGLAFTAIGALGGAVAIFIWAQRMDRFVDLTAHAYASAARPACMARNEAVWFPATYPDSSLVLQVDGPTTARFSGSRCVGP